MWFPLGLQNFIGKKIISHDSCDIYVSDFSRIWHKSLSDNEILSISKSLNPLFEATVQKLKDVTLSLLEDVRVQKNIREDDDSNIFLKLRSNIMGVKFQFEVLLNQGDGETLFKEFTLPMLLLLVKFQNKEKKLIKIIEEKDAEIEDYKQEYGDKSSYLATKPFNQKEFECENSEAETWDPVPFLDCINAKILSVKAVPTDIKGEECLEQDLGEKSSDNKCDKTKLVFKDKNISFNPCVFFDNQTIKKKRKHNDTLKIKF